jgi:hypothetical protein
MTDYSSEEITAAVEKIVASAVRRPYGRFGNRDIQAAFTDLQDAAAGVFVLNVSAPFYTALLGAGRLNELLVPLTQTINELLEALANVNRRVREIDNLAPLNNAKAALAALELAASGRSQGFTSIESTPAYQRYDANTQRFLTDASANSRKNGQIVPTPQESRAAIPRLVTSMRDLHTVVKDRARFLRDSIGDYDALQLPSLLAQGVISRAKQVLQDRIDELTPLSPADRLAKIRGVTLDILAGKAAVLGLGSLRQTTVFALLEGDATPFVDDAHPAVPAFISSELAGPYPILSGGNELYTTTDGSFLSQLTLPGSFVPTMDGTNVEPWDIVAALNDVLIFTYDGYAATTITFPATFDYTVDDAILEINTQIALLASPPPIEAVAHLRVRKYEGIVESIVGVGPDYDFTLSATTGFTWETLNVSVGDRAIITNSFIGANVGTEFTVTVVAGLLFTATQVIGAAITVEPPAPFEFPAVRVGATRVIRLQIKDSDRIAALNERKAITLDPVDANNSLTTFGFTKGASLRARSTYADTVAQGINLSAFIRSFDTVRLTAEETFVPILSRKLHGRSNPDSSTKIIAYVFRGRADTVGGDPATFSAVGASTAGVQLGDVLVIRDTTILADSNLKGIVTAVSDTSITADMDAAVTAGNQLLIEVSDPFDIPTLIGALSPSTAYLEFKVTKSRGQDGLYTMSFNGQTVVPFEFSVEKPVSGNRAQGGAPVFFDIEVGLRKVTLRSTSVKASTSISVNDSAGTSPAYDKFFTSVSPVAAAGTTPWLKLPKDPKSLGVGDMLEVYSTVYNVPSSTYSLVSLDLSLLLVELSANLPVSLPPINLSNNSPVPFARIRLLQNDNFGVFEAGTTKWLLLSENRDDYYTELTRLLNQVLVSTNPPPYLIGSVTLHVQQLLAILTQAGAESVGQDPDVSLETIIENYQVGHVDSVDALIEAFQARGATRGLDILLQGRFSEFFGLTMEGMSFDGALREQLRDVARQDLPVRKFGRAERTAQESIIGQFEVADSDKNFDDSPGDFTRNIPDTFTNSFPPDE